MLSRFARTALLLLLAAAGPGRAAPAPAAAAPAPAADPVDALRAEFRDALDRIWQPGAVTGRKELRAYILYPYLQAGRLRKDLGKVPDRQRLASLEKQIRHFLERHADEPVTRDLRRDFLAYLGERAAWPDFTEVAQAQPPTDLSLRCYAWTGRLARKQADGLRDTALELWLALREVPPACAPVVNWIDDPARLSDAEIEERALFAAQNRVPLPDALRGLLPPRQALLRYRARLMDQPERELKLYLAGERPAAVAEPPDPEVADALIEAFTRVARRDSKQAALIYEPLLRLPFAEDQKQRLKREHALGLAYDFDPAALAAFEQLPEASLDPLSHEWRVRVALWNREWPLVQRWVEGMPEPQRAEPRWRYWLARAVERSQRAPAKSMYEEVAKEREYYAFLAAERLGRKPDLRPQPVVPDSSVQATLVSLAPIQRAHELFRCELHALAGAELRHALSDRSPAEKMQAATLVAGWGWYEPAVRLISETQNWDDLGLRYPLPYADMIERAARDNSLPGEWLYTVLRTESLYDPRAVSRVGALGLLQLMLPTARQVAARNGMPPPQRDDLFKPEVNIALGARYLRELLQQFDQRFILTLAAYNAGPQRVPDWLPQKAVEGDIWIENIPYNETRTYVQRALSSLVFLSWRRNGDPARLAPLLQPVAAPLATPEAPKPVASR